MFTFSTDVQAQIKFLHVCVGEKQTVSVCLCVCVCVSAQGRQFLYGVGLYTQTRWEYPLNDLWH